MGWQDDAIVEPAAAPAAKQPWENDAIVAPAAGPRVASGIGEAWTAGYQGSLAGLADRGKLPDVVLDAHHAKWYEKLVAGASQMVNEGPEMIAGAAAGGAGGAALGGAIGSVVPVAGTAAGAAVGGVLGGGAGAFAAPTAIRESLMQYYAHRDGVSSADFLTRAGIVIKATGKDALIGALTAGAGSVTGKLAAPLVESAVTAGRIGATTGKVAAGAAVAGAEVGTMTVLPAAMEGRLPEPEDFMNAAILVAGLKGAGAAAGRLRQVYAETGRRPEQVLVDAKSDPTIAHDLTSGVEVTEIPFDPKMFGEVGVRENNASGESAASLEAQSRLAQETSQGQHRYVISTRNGEVRPLTGVDAVDTVAGAHEMVVQNGVGKDPWTVLDKGDSVTGNAATAALARARGALDQAQLDRLATNTEIPRAYQAEAIQNRAADIVPGVKTEEVRTEPFGPVTQVAGEPAKPTEINYNFMHTTEDAKAALVRLATVYEAEIQTQRRGTVTWEQTQVEAGQHIADMLGSTTPFEPRAPGAAAGAAELLARKQMLQGAAEDMATKAREYLATPETVRTPQQTAEYLASIERAAMIQAEFLGARAEAGRALNILKETKLAAERAEQIQELIARYGKDPADLARMLADIDNPAAALKFAKEASKATTWEKLIEAWKAGLVSGPITQVANVMGNTTFMAARPLVDTVAASIGLVTRGPERVRMVEPLARVVGNLQGVSDGLRMARVAFLEDAPAGKADSFRQAIPGTTGYVIRTPFRALSAMDALFRNMTERGEVNAIAARQAAKEGYNPATREFRERMAEIAGDLTPEQAAAAAEFATRATFQAKPGEIATKVFAGIDAIPGSELIVPFKITPLNVFKEATRISPAAPLVGEWRAAIAKGGPEAQKAMAELAVGTGIAALTSMWALSGNISGNGDPDPNKRRAAMAAGWQPYSIKIGDTWHSYQRMAPLGLVVGAAADAADIAHYATPEESGTVAKMVAAMFANAVTNATFLQGITQFNNVINDPQRYGPSFIRGLAASPIPAVVSQTAQLMDPYQREVGSVTEAIKSRIPAVRESLTPTRDTFGEPVPNPNTVFAVKTSKESDDPVRKEAARLKVGTPEAPKSIDLPAGGTGLGKVQLTQEQRDIFGSEAGHLAHDIMAPMVNSPGWQYMPDFAKEKAFKMVFEKSREFGKYKALTADQRQQEVQRITTEIGKKLAQ